MPTQRASTIPINHQIEIMEWLREHKDYFNKTEDHLVWAYYDEKFTNPQTGMRYYPDMTKSKFTRFLRTQGIVRTSARIDGRVAKVYVINPYDMSPNSALEFRMPGKVVCTQCNGTGWVGPNEAQQQLGQ